MNKVVPLKVAKKDVGKPKEEKETVKQQSKKPEEQKATSSEAEKSTKSTKSSGESPRTHASFLSSEHQKSISIKISEFLHPNAPDISTSSEQLLETVQLKPLRGGLANPSFSIENASDSSSPRNSSNIFSFEDSDIEELSNTRRRIVRNVSESKPLEEGLRPGDKIICVQPAKTVLTPGNKNSEGGGQLHVPRFSEVRRPSDPTSLNNAKQLPPASPGFYGNSKYDLQPPPSPGLLSINSAWSELAKLHSRRSSYGDFSDTRSNSLSNVSSSLSQYLHDLVRAFSSRTEKIKENTIQPPTPSSLSEVDALSEANSGIFDDQLNASINTVSTISVAEDDAARQNRINNFYPDHLKLGPDGLPTEEEIDKFYMDWGCCKSPLPNCCKQLQFPSILEPQSKIYMCWLALVTLCFTYNVSVIPLRGIFPYQTPSNVTYWLICDYISDLVYLLDILVFKPRLTFLNSGLLERDMKLTKKNYMKKKMFKFDVLSLIPLDLFYLKVGVVPWLRLPRYLKIQTFWEFFERCDQAVRSAHILRIIKTMIYMLFLIHVETCGYYAMSVYEGIGSNRWVYNGVGNAYIRCFYLATKTATSIGNNPQPTNVKEYVFMTVYWVSGVFVFALLIGQIRDIVDAAGRVKALYNKRMDAAIWYVKNLNLPKETQEKVRTWFIYNWQQQKILDEKVLMNTLPKNLRTDLAIHVHFNTLSKVKLFQDCDKTLLFDLVLKLKPILYLPGDYVCRKGEVGKEMYIVSQGHVDVVGGPDNSIVLATLKEGSVFGEISLLALSGGEGNRRTADVVCKGFTNLFILSKGDFEAAMSEYPEAHRHMKKRAKKLLRQNAKLAKESAESLGSTPVDEIIKSTSVISRTPKMVQTVMQVMDPDSDIMKKLCHKSHDSDGSNTQDTKETETTGRGLPTDQEVEDFYNEMLTVEVPVPTPGPRRENSLKKGIGKLKKEDTTTTEQSEESADSGVQLVKATSPTTSITKTMSNKESKESVITSEITTELADILEETRSWVEQQTLHTQMISDGGYLAEFFEDNLTNDPKKDPTPDPKDHGCLDKIELHGDLKVEEKEIQVDSIDNLLSKIEEDQGAEGKNVKEAGDSNGDEGPTATLKEENEIVDVEGKKRKTVSEMNEEERLEDVKVKDIKETKQNHTSNLEESEVNNTISTGESKTDAKPNNIINIEIKNRAYSVNSNSSLAESEIMDTESKTVIKQEPKQSVSKLSPSDVPRIPSKNRIVCTVEVHQQRSITPTPPGEGQERGAVELQKQGSNSPSSTPRELQYFESSV
ncbi:cyclic nucleotide-gated cation channel beta-1-like isoform X3 [Crassostrea angulata]|uniref:cyclic nucleotide-gated cation channel beta-1-like isoform X3 n=1 Tax=Magallana angulata TaxID=2784310 RepID=UPI0022B0AA10|nr:cyclic nucleotide-gated cation channel beta-1-like isoform X3 [Crassostrea angulata]